MLSPWAIDYAVVILPDPSIDPDEVIMVVVQGFTIYVHCIFGRGNEQKCSDGMCCPVHLFEEMHYKPYCL